MIKEIIENNITANVTALSTSTGLVSLWFLDINEKTLGLGIAGFIIAIASFINDYANSTKKRTKLQVFSEILKYMIFGTVAFPSAYVFLSDYIEHEMLHIAGGVFASYFVVYFLDIIVKALGKVIAYIGENWRPLK